MAYNEETFEDNNLQELRYFQLEENDVGASGGHKFWLGYPIGLKFYREFHLKEFTVVLILSFRLDIISTLF